MNPKQTPSLKVKILSPREVIFEGEASSVSSQNLSGNFDILPLHANFITLIENNTIKVTALDKTVTSFNFPVAIIYQINNQVNIYTDLEFK